MGFMDKLKDTFTTADDEMEVELDETEAKAFKYESAETKSFTVAKTAGVANTNKQIWHKDEMISYNYSVKGKLVIGESDKNPHIQFSLSFKEE